jgi:hypothetical protein
MTIGLSVPVAAARLGLQYLCPGSRPTVRASQRRVSGGSGPALGAEALLAGERAPPLPKSAMGPLPRRAISTPPMEAAAGCPSCGGSRLTRRKCSNSSPLGIFTRSRHLFPYLVIGGSVRSRAVADGGVLFISRAPRKRRLPPAPARRLDPPPCASTIRLQMVKPRSYPGSSRPRGGARLLPGLAGACRWRRCRVRQILWSDTLVAVDPA